MSDLDRGRVEKLTKSILLLLKDYYLSESVARERVFEVLNALAVATAVVLEGTGREALDFYFKVLNAQMKMVTELKAKEKQN